MKMVRAWRHNPRQVYGPGELIYRNAELGDPLPPGQLTLTVGANPNGLSFGFDATAFGSIAPPETMQAAQLILFYAEGNSAYGRTDIQSESFGQIEGTWESVTIDIAGNPFGPYTVPWNAGSQRYRNAPGVDLTTADFVKANNGNDLVVTLTDGGPVPLVVPAITTRAKRRKRRAKK